MRGENSAYKLLVEFQTKGEVNLLGYAGAAETRIALLDLDNCIDHFLGWPFGSSLATTAL